jgi:hypothetical protein
MVDDCRGQNHGRKFYRKLGLMGAVTLFVVVMGVMVYHHTHKTSDGPYQQPVQSSLKFHTLFL